MAADREIRGDGACSGAALLRDGVLHFEVPGLLLCLPLPSVSRVLLIAALQPLPAAPSFVRGLLNLHGTPLPVVDLAARLGYPMPEHYRAETPMLHCEHGSRHAVLLVSRVVGPALAAEEDVIPLRETADPVFLGAIPVNQRMSLLLDPGALLDLDPALGRPEAPPGERTAPLLRAMGVT